MKYCGYIKQSAIETILLSYCSIYFDFLLNILLFILHALRDCMDFFDAYISVKFHNKILTVYKIWLGLL